MSGHTIATQSRHRYTPARRNRGRWVLVYCPMCEIWISDESRHPCEQSPALRDRRVELRKMKMMEAGIRDYD